MKKLNIPLVPVITGALALIAVAAVLIIVIGAGGDAGLYVTEASGSVSISNVDNQSVDSASGEALRQGDIITVGEGASCRLMYKSKKNSEDNFILVSSGSQLVITDDLNGKKSGEIYLNRGSALCSLAGDDNAQIYIRTADSMVYPEGTVTKVGYTTNGFEAYTDVYTFMGNSKIQLYDAQGNTVNAPEFLVEKRAGRVTTNDLGPVFSYLNIEFSLNELTAYDLKNLVTISSLAESFPYTTEELKAAYDAAPDNSASISEQTSDSSEVIQTAAPIDTAPTETESVQQATTGPSITHQTQAPQTTTAPPASTTTTAAPPVSSSESTSPSADDSRTFVVVVIIDGEETIQEVPYGGSAEKPDDPVIDGKTFIGWDKSFDNITEDTTITALFSDSATDGNEIYHTVTIKIADKVTTVTVKDGETAPLPSAINIEGYIFKGWDTDYTNVKSDITVTAILESVQPAAQYTVTFIIDGVPYPQIVSSGGTAVPPVTPTADSHGNLFTGWDKPLENITSDTVITAQYAQAEHTVTFVVEGVSYPVKVKHGEAAVPPVIPSTDSTGTKIFFAWDNDYSNVTYDMTVTAIFI